MPPLPRRPALPRFAPLLLLSATLAGGVGPASAVSTGTLLTPTGTHAIERVGDAVARAGDVNGDGYDDVIVGAPLSEVAATDAGRAFVHFGGPAADAVADLTLIAAAAFDNFGFSVDGAGDVNGDGYDDVIVGAPLNDAGGGSAGRAYVYFGGPAADATADLILTGGAGGAFLGYSVAGVGDVNGDGYDDLLVGAQGAAGSGQAYLYLGGAVPNAVADQTFTGEAAGDAFGLDVAAGGDINGDGLADLLVGAPDNDAGGSLAGRAYVFLGGAATDAIADLTLTGGGVGHRYGYSLAGAGDVNGDGYDDLIVGTGSAGGVAYVYYGGPIANSTADLTLSGAAPGDEFGDAVAGAGDVNGDGYADVMVGAYGNDAGGTEAGQVYVYYGGPGADALFDLALIGRQPAEFFGYALAAAGDVNGDGRADLIVGAPGSNAGGFVASGRAYVLETYPFKVLSPNGREQWVAGRSATVRWRGHDVADVALSRDGGASWSPLAVGVGGRAENELAVVAPGPATDLALVRVSYTGQAATRASSDASDAAFRIALATPPPAAAHRLQLTATGAAPSDHFGVSVAGAGDVDGDGFGDLIVGAEWNDAGGSEAGRAYVYHGGPGADAVADLTLTGEAPGDVFGVSVAGAGDVNRDGFADLIVGAEGNDAAGFSAGRAYVYHGGPGADAVADLTLTGEGPDDRFGSSVAGAGDVNGDGFADVIVGAYTHDAIWVDAGRAYVYYGGPAADATADLTLSGGTTAEFLGRGVAGAGDVNGDGFADLLVGAPGDGAGRAYVYFGGPAADATADLTLTGEVDGDAFGASVAGAGDVDGDGCADLLVGASASDAGGLDVGRAYLFLGGPTADAVADLVLTGSTAEEYFGGAVAGAGDVNGDGLADLLVGAQGSYAGGPEAGRAYAFYGGPAADTRADLILTGAGAGDRLGCAVAGAGDVNGDGFGDLLVGALAGASGAGRADLHDWNRYLVLAPNDDEVWNVGASATVTWLGAEPADLWLSVNGGQSYERLRSAVGGAPSNAVTLLVPHAPTRFARVRVTPASGIAGQDESDSLFTIQSSVALLSFAASLSERGAELSWSTEPGVGPGGLAGYRLYRLAPGAGGNGSRVGPELIAEDHYRDPDGAAGSTYRLVAVNGLMEELELGRVSVVPARPLAAWPLPYRGGALSVSFATAGGLGGGSADASLELFDPAGRRLRTMVRGAFEAGYHALTWDGLDDRGRPVANGLYILRARSLGHDERLKVVVAR